MPQQNRILNTDDFDYQLPESCIAQQPMTPRDASRLMVLDRDSGQILHQHFYDLARLLQPTDVLVLNETQVLPARIHAVKLPGGGKAEILLLRRLEPQTWQALVGGKGIRAGQQLRIGDDLIVDVIQELDGPQRILHFERPISSRLSNLGEMPVPPYIHEPLPSPERYQTVFARHPGSAAAPTAGLHFTDELLARLKQQGVKIAWITLHVGLDTFAPVRSRDPRRHPIHREWCFLSQSSAELIRHTRAVQGRVIAVGTTSVRTLESAAGEIRSGKAYEGFTGLFILPGYEFQMVDAMITNFHLPRSTLLMLVSAFASRNRILEAYETAIQEGYRFYSFGDAMLIQ